MEATLSSKMCLHINQVTRSNIPAEINM